MIELNYWPSAMRQAGSAGVSGAPQLNAVVFEPEIGPPIARRRASSFVRNYRINFNLLTRAEYDAFQTFFHETLSDGVTPFAWRHPMTNALHRCRFKLSGGESYREAKRMNEFYDIEFELIVLDDISNAASDALGDEIGIYFDFVNMLVFARFADDQISTGAIADYISFLRTNDAMYVGSDGLIRTAASNVLREHYNPLTLAKRGILIEAATSNWCFPSNDFASANYSKSSISVSTASQTSPFFGVLADQINFTSGSSFFFGSCSPAGMSNKRVTWSFFAKAGTKPSIQIRFDLTGGVLAQYLATFTFATATFSGVTAGATMRAENYGNGWYRISIAATDTGSNTGVLIVWAANGVSGTINLIGSQVEVNPDMTSPIYTSIGAATRFAESATINIANIPFNNAQGTVVAVGASDLPASSGVNRTLLSVRNAGITDVTNLIFNASGTSETHVIDNSVAQAVLTGPAYAVGSEKRLAYSFSANNFAFSDTGGTVVTDTNGTLPTPTLIEFGALASTHALNGTLKAVGILSRRATNAELLTILG